LLRQGVALGGVAPASAARPKRTICVTTSPAPDGVVVRFSASVKLSPKTSAMRRACRLHPDRHALAERHGRSACAIEQTVCLLQRAAIPLTPAAQELATMLASYTRTVQGR